MKPSNSDDWVWVVLVLVILAVIVAQLKEIRDIAPMYTAIDRPYP